MVFPIYFTSNSLNCNLFVFCNVIYNHIFIYIQAVSQNRFIFLLTSYTHTLQHMAHLTRKADYYNYKFSGLCGKKTHKQNFFGQLIQTSNSISSKYFPNISLGQLVGEPIIFCQFMNEIQKMFLQNKGQTSAVLSSVVKFLRSQYDKFVLSLTCLILITKLECHR